MELRAAEALVGVIRSPLALLMTVQAQKRDLQKSGPVTTQKLFDWFQKVSWSKETESLTKGTLELVAIGCAPPPVLHPPSHPSLHCCVHHALIA